MVWATVTAAQSELDDVQIKAAHVAGKVHMFEGAGGNIGVSVGEDGILIVDDQFAPLADKIRAALKDLGDGKLKFVLNTHWHFDHTGGNPEFGPEAPIIAHTNVRKLLSSPQELLGRMREPLPKEGLPVITFDDALSVHFNGEEIKVLHYPHSHTDGDSVVYFTGSNVVHMGDLLFNGMFPFVDVEHGGDVEGLARSVKKITDTLPEGAKIIPGHGPLSTKADLLAFHEMLVETTNVVRAAIQAGKSLEDIQSAGLPEEYQKWSQGFINADRWVELVYKSLTK